MSIAGFGPRKILNLISKFKSFENIFNADFSTLQLINGFNELSANKLLKNIDNYDLIKKNCLIEAEKLNKLNAGVITFFDEEYPELLKEIYNPPLILYFKGNIDISKNSNVAVVGTRNPTSYGKMQTEKIVKDLCGKNITIVSGLARGIDSVAHYSALSSNGQTIAVTGSGLDVIYPPENRNLFTEICENGLIISEYELGTKPDAINFPKRNRIISGISLGSLVVETKLNGGAMQTASYALDQNREVFALPGNIGVNQSEGTNMLIQKGSAKLVTNADDILVELNLKLNPEVGINIPRPSIELNLFEEKILNVINNNPIHIDEIANKSNLSASDCLVNLLSLEFKGLVKQLPGKVFQLYN
ncbi:MAG: DNA-processing protein DprA [Bacteroidetes bacterium]|nr:DNA-processing protein DprA [Bacteroidota bacterium]